MYSSIYRVQSSTRKLPIQALFGFTLKLVESYLSPSPQSLCVVVCPWCQPWVASNSTSSISSTTISSISTTALSGEDRHVRLVHCCFPFDLLLVCACSLGSLSDCDSSSPDDGDRARFPFDFEPLLLDSRERDPLLGGITTAFSVGRCTRSDLRDIAEASRLEGRLWPK